MKKKVAQYIHTHHLLPPSAKVLVAVSGGADSVALLHVLRSLRYEVHAMHCNFHLREEESNRDEAFVQSLCQTMDVPLLIQHFSTQEYAQAHHISIEMAARELRYEWFHECIRNTGAHAIAVGHHADDQAETLLINLLRGTGIRGLAGMHPRQGQIVRPLLCVNKTEIESYLQAHQLTYVIDSSNLKADVVRNRIRLEVLPLLEQIQPAVHHTLARTCEHIRQSIPLYQKGVYHSLSQAGIQKERLHLSTFLQHPDARPILYEWLSPYGFNMAQLEDIFLQASQETSGLLWESASHRLLKDREYLFLQKIGEQTPLPTLTYTPVEKMEGFSVEHIYVDAQRLQEPLTVRRVQSGDWFVPFGMKGKKLLSNFMTDCKFTRFQKEQQAVLCAGNEIVWVIGVRADNRFRIGPETKNIIKISIASL